MTKKWGLTVSTPFNSLITVGAGIPNIRISMVGACSVFQWSLVNETWAGVEPGI